MPDRLASRLRGRKPVGSDTPYCIRPDTLLYHLDVPPLAADCFVILDLQSGPKGANLT
jgi:hypothetical protein